MILRAAPGRLVDLRPRAPSRGPATLNGPAPVGAPAMLLGVPDGVPSGGARVVALAHRGAHGPGAPENTLPAVLAAQALGYRWVETDLRATADAVPVLAHDASLRRTAGLDAEVAALSWEQLAAVALGGTTPPVAPVRLEEALDAAPGVALNLDVKAADAVRPLLDLLARRPELRSRLRVTSFSERRRAAVLLGLRARGLGRVASSASAPGTAACWALAHAPLPRAVRAAGLRALATVLGIDCLQVPERAVVRLLGARGVLPVVTARLLRTARAAGLGVHVWVVDDVDDMHRLLDAGVDGLVTDRAEVLAGVLAERGQWPGAPPAPPAIPPARGAR